MIDTIIDGLREFQAAYNFIKNEDEWFYNRSMEQHRDLP